MSLIHFVSSWLSKASGSLYTALGSLRIASGSLCIASLFLSVGSCAAQSATPRAGSLPPRLSHSIDSTFRANYPPSAPGCVVLIAEYGKPLFKKAYGQASVELNVPDNTDNLFAIGSMTKQFTALAVLQLEQANKLSLNDDIRKYLPGYNTHGRIITIRHLLTHTSGIADFAHLPGFLQNYTRDWSKKEQVALFENDSLQFEPGAKWSYSNSGYLLAGLIIESVSGMSYEDYVKKNIFIPLGMEHTRFGTHEEIIPHLASGYDPADSTHMMPGFYYSWSWTYAAGGILSTVDDLLKWDEALYSDKILSQARIKEAQSPYILSTGKSAGYGYGWFIGNDHGITVISHGGYVGGYKSEAIRIPSKHLYAVVLSNGTLVNPGDLLRPVALKVADIPAKP